MKIKFKAMQKNGDLTIESYDIKTENNEFDTQYYLYHKYNTSISSYGSMWIEIDASTLEIIKE